jgi:hypothetical protein
MGLLLDSLTLLAIGTPSQLLLLDILGIFKAPRSIRLLAPPAFVLITAISIYATIVQSPLANLILVGLISGVLGTVALDSIRIPGYLLGYMPLDLPLRFGTKALNLDDKFMLGMMPKVLGYVNDQMAKGASPKSLMNEKGFPALPLNVIRSFAKPTMTEVLHQNGVPLWKVRLTGYLWHYSNGASFGIAHAVLFGKGPWIFTIGFGLLLAIVFLTIIRFLIPPMSVGFKLPAVVLLAHIAVILVLGSFVQSYVTPAGDGESIIHYTLAILHLA